MNIDLVRKVATTCVGLCGHGLPSSIPIQYYVFLFYLHPPDSCVRFCPGMSNLRLTGLSDTTNQHHVPSLTQASPGSPMSGGKSVEGGKGGSWTFVNLSWLQLCNAEGSGLGLAVND